MATRDPRTGRRPVLGRGPSRAVLPGAEAFAVPGGRVGALVLHGFTGSPQGVRPWAQGLADAGLTVAVPRLPGHGTDVADLARSRWRDWYALARADLLELRRRCDVVLVAGLSMGGALALRLAAHEPAAVDGVALVNPAVLLGNPILAAVPLLRWLTPTVRGVGGDIALEGGRELAYDRVPLHALHSFVGLMASVRVELGEVRAPLLLMRSAVDHVVPAQSSTVVAEGVASRDVREVVLPRSHHVATLDHDLPLVVAETVAAARALSQGRPLSAVDETATADVPAVRSA